MMNARQRVTVALLGLVVAGCGAGSSGPTGLTDAAFAWCISNTSSVQATADALGYNPLTIGEYDMPDPRHFTYKATDKTRNNPGFQKVCQAAFDGR
jgi:hypothetical protein